MKEKSIKIQKFDDLIPAPNSRTVLIGKTGSGKTTFARLLLTRFYRFVIVYDVKAMMKQSEWPDFVFVEKIDDLERLGDQRDLFGRVVNPKIIYQPVFSEVPDGGDLDSAERFFRYVYERKNTVLFIDEVYGVTVGRKIPYWYKAILTRGRERKITLISATQRPKEIPVFILSESENYVVFSLQMPQDIELLERIKGIDAGAIKALDKFEFLIANEFDAASKKLKLKF